MVDVVQVMATLAAMVVVVGGIAAAVAAMRKWVQGLAASASRAEKAATVAAQQTTEQLATSNGHTIGEYVEQTAEAVTKVTKDIQDVRAEVGVLVGWAGENRDLALVAAQRADMAFQNAEEAKRIAQATADRLDAHLIGHHLETS